MIALITERLEQRGLTDPYYHAISRPMIAENEASYRAIALAELVDTPILIVHMSSEVAMATVRKAQTRMLPIHAETCPQYLFLLSERLKGNDFEGAKCVCSPPLRHEKSDLDALWQSVANGTITTFSSDHAPSKFYEEGGKRLGIINGLPVFRKIPNGLPGVETRMSLLFSESCGPNARISLPRFVQVTAAHPAKLYGLGALKGSIAPGFDADLVVWHPEGHFAEGLEIQQSMLHHGVDYTPYEGMKVKNWPRYTFLRGKMVWNRDSGGIVGEMGFGNFVKRAKGEIVVGRTGGHVKGMLAEERDMWM
jgi:dihydropyrimidinase